MEGWDYLGGKKKPLDCSVTLGRGAGVYLGRSEVEMVVVEVEFRP